MAAAGRHELIVAHVLATGLSMYPELTAAALQTTEDDALAQLLPEVWEALIDADVRWRAVCIRGVPAQELVALSRSVHPAAVVVGADTPGWCARLRRGFSGSTPARLTRNQDAPVIVVPAGCSHRRRGRVDEGARVAAPRHHRRHT